MDAGGRATQGAVAEGRADYGAEDAGVVQEWAAYEAEDAN